MAENVRNESLVLVWYLSQQTNAWGATFVKAVRLDQSNESDLRT